MKMTKSRMSSRCVIILFVFIIIPSYYVQASYGGSELGKPIQESNEVIMQSCNCVAFRLDDIQGYWLNDVQIAVMEVFQKQDIPLTIGIIGGEQFKFGIDPKITDYVRGLLAERSTIKIANHGWNHESFVTYDKKMQSDLLKKSNERLFQILEVTPKTFIPPFNEFDDNTIIALQENQFTHFSPSLITSSPPYLPNDSNLYSFPETAATGEMRDLGLFEGIGFEKTFEDIQIGVDNFGFAVVMMHPQEFSVIENEVYTNVVNGTQIKELELLVNKIHDEGLQIVFLEEIDKNVQSNSILIPKWFEKTLQWRGEEKISYSEFSDAMNYLKRQGIVEFGIKNLDF